MALRQQPGTNRPSSSSSSLHETNPTVVEQQPGPPSGNASLLSGSGTRSSGHAFDPATTASAAAGSSTDDDPLAMSWLDEGQADARLPRMDSITLLLAPRRYEVAFWQSPATCRAALVVDKWACSILVVANCLYLRWGLRTEWTADKARQRRYAEAVLAQCAVLLACNVAQLVWLLASPRVYSRYRTKVLLANRCIRLAHACILTRLGRIAMSRYSTAPIRVAAYISRTTSRYSLPPQLKVLHCAIHTMGASVALFYTGLAPLPFLLQLPVQLAYLAIMVAFQMPVAQLVMQHLARAQDSMHLCQSFNLVLDLASQAYLGASPSTRSLNRKCEQYGAQMVLVFVALYVGMVIPTYMAYHLERQQKAAFIEQMRRLAEREGDGESDEEGALAGGAECQQGFRWAWLLGMGYQAVLVVLMGAQVWVVVLKLAPHLHRLVLPLPLQ